MIQAVPTASFNLSIPSAGATSTGARSRQAALLATPAKKGSTGYAGGGGSTPDGVVSAADLAPPSVQTYPVHAQAPAAAGMSMTTKVALFGGIALVAGIAIVVATRR